MARKRTAVERDLSDCGTQLARATADVEKWRTRREDLLIEGREVVPPIEHPVAAQLLGLDGETSVMRIIRQARKKRA